MQKMEKASDKYFDFLVAFRMNKKREPEISIN